MVADSQSEREGRTFYGANAAFSVIAHRPSDAKRPWFPEPDKSPTRTIVFAP